MIHESHDNRKTLSRVCRYFLTLVEEGYGLDTPTPARSVKFRMEHRLEDKASGKVRYEQSEEYILSLNVPTPEVSEVLDATSFACNVQTK